MSSERPTLSHLGCEGRRGQLPVIAALHVIASQSRVYRAASGDRLSGAHSRLVGKVLGHGAGARISCVADAPATDTNNSCSAVAATTASGKKILLVAPINPSYKSCSIRNLTHEEKPSFTLR
jgi:hypothetical protein